MRSSGPWIFYFEDLPVFEVTERKDRLSHVVRINVRDSAKDTSLAEIDLTFDGRYADRIKAMVATLNAATVVEESVADMLAREAAERGDGVVGDQS